MKIAYSSNIRKGTFETNSSSAHTVILVNTDEKIDAKKLVEEYLEEKSKLSDENGRKYFPIPVDITGERYSFGQSFAIYTDWEEKLAYLIAASAASKVNKKLILKMIREIVNVDIAGFITYIDEWSAENIYKQFNSNINKLYKLPEYSEYEFCGSIDHQSNDTIDACIDAMRKFEKYSNMSEEELYYEIVFSQNIAIVEDSDSSDGLHAVLLSNIISSDTITHVLVNDYGDGYENVKGVFRSTEDYLTKSSEEDY